MIKQDDDNRYPVDPTDDLTMGSIPDDALDRMIAATAVPDSPLTRLRSAIADVDPQSLTASDATALLGLVQAAWKSNSAFGQRMREQDAARIRAATERPSTEADQ